MLALSILSGFLVLSVSSAFELMKRQKSLRKLENDFVSVLQYLSHCILVTMCLSGWSEDGYLSPSLFSNSSLLGMMIGRIYILSQI